MGPSGGFVKLQNIYDTAKQLVNYFSEYPAYHRGLEQLQEDYS